MSGQVHSMDESRAKQRLRHGANLDRHIEPPAHHFRFVIRHAKLALTHF